MGFSNEKMAGPGMNLWIGCKGKFAGKVLIHTQCGKPENGGPVNDVP